MTGMEAIATAHALKAAGAIYSWKQETVERQVYVIALVDADRYGRLRVTAQCVSYESAILALLWRLAELEGQVAA